MLSYFFRGMLTVGLQPAVVKFSGKKVLLMVTPKDSYSLGPMLFLTKPRWYNEKDQEIKTILWDQSDFSGIILGKFAFFTLMFLLLEGPILKVEMLGYRHKGDPIRESKRECTTRAALTSLIHSSNGSYLGRMATGSLAPLLTGGLVSPENGKTDFLFVSRSGKVTLQFLNVNYFHVFPIIPVLGEQKLTKLKVFSYSFYRQVTFFLSM